MPCLVVVGDRERDSQAPRLIVVSSKFPLGELSNPYQTRAEGYDLSSGLTSRILLGFEKIRRCSNGRGRLIWGVGLVVSPSLLLEWTISMISSSD